MKKIIFSLIILFVAAGTGLLVTGCEDEPTPPANLFSPQNDGTLLSPSGAIEDIDFTITPEAEFNSENIPVVKTGDRFAVLLQGYLSGATFKECVFKDDIELLGEDETAWYFKALQATTDYGSTIISYRQMASLKFFYIKIVNP